MVYDLVNRSLSIFSRLICIAAIIFIWFAFYIVNNIRTFLYNIEGYEIPLLGKNFFISFNDERIAFHWGVLLFLAIVMGTFYLISRKIISNYPRYNLDTDIIFYPVRALLLWAIFAVGLFYINLYFLDELLLEVIALAMVTCVLFIFYRYFKEC